MSKSISGLFSGRGLFSNKPEIFFDVVRDSAKLNNIYFSHTYFDFRQATKLFHRMYSLR